ncbi:MAG: N-formylglutamate amidohydrolase [Pseudomonadota bacterium]
MSQLAADTLLSADDPPPVEVVAADNGCRVFLLCEHAGCAIPASLGDLGVSAAVLASHRGWDIGAEALARALSSRLGAPLVIQRYSRLVIDCNRPPDSPLSIPTESDGIVVPGNRNALAPPRVAEIFDPMNAAIDALLTNDCVAAFSVHSFTPKMDDVSRPWHAGFLSRADLSTAGALRDHIAAARPDLTLSINEPYRIETDSDWFIPAHAEPRGLKHCLIEVRNDQLSDEAGVTLWADLLAEAIATVVEAA